MNDTTIKASESQILASLQIKGVTEQGDSPNKAQFIPLLNKDGQLDASFLPIEKIGSSLTFKSLSNLAYIDYENSSSSPDGSILFPFHTIADAVAEGFFNFILTPAFYSTTETIECSQMKGRLYGDAICFISSAKTVLPGFEIRESAEELGKVILYNTSISNLHIVGPGGGSDLNYEVCLLGNSSIENISSSNVSSITITLSPESTYTNTDLNSNISVRYFSRSDYVENNSNIEGFSVTDVLNTLHERSIVSPRYGYDANGIKEVEPTTVRADDENSFNLRNDSLVTAINKTFYKKDDNPTFTNITGKNVSSEKTSASIEVSTPILKLSNTKLKVTDNFLVIE